MSYSHTSTLLNGMHVGPSDNFSGIWNLTEWTDFVNVKELTFILRMEQTVNTPTSGELKPSFQIGIHQTAGQQYNAVRFTNLDSAQKSTLILEGEEWENIAYNKGTTLQKRTIKGFGRLCNLHLDASNLSPTNSAFVITVELLQKGI